jgi:hypothetical protein
MHGMHLAVVAVAAMLVLGGGERSGNGKGGGNLGSRKVGQLGGQTMAVQHNII